MSCIVKIQGIPIDLDKPQELQNYLLTHHLSTSELTHLDLVMAQHPIQWFEYSGWCFIHYSSMAVAHVGKLVDHLF